MSTNFTSLQMIKDQFGIETESIDSVRSELRTMLVKLHPDKNGGNFVDENCKKNYHEIDDAITFIDGLSKKNFELVTISAVTDLTKAVTAMVETHSKLSSKETQLSSEIDRSIENYSSRIKTPRIALTAITVVISAIWLFPNTVEDHPVLSKLISFDNIITNAVWLDMLILAAAFWVITWRKEERNKNFQESLKTESVQNRIFNDFINNFKGDVFTLEEFVDFIKGGSEGHSISHLLNGSREIDSTLAHATAEVILERALKKNALTSYNSNSISTMYRITSTIS